jgi:ATP-dependent Clp protease ATP-binding subunit ClpB
MEERLRERVIGQDAALTVVANAIRRSRAGLSDPKRPIGSFIFLGPTGVGKTETARALAEYLFDDEQAMVRIDMSEYMEKHAVARLIGAPPGYVGYDEGGQLTEAIHRRPYAVILFDEIEKAHPDVFNILLQVMDDGRLTDAKGRTVSFKNTVLIMTSNLGAALLTTDALKNEHDFGIAQESVMEVLRQHFRPEFLNRVDDTVIFHPLGNTQMSKILDLRLNELRKMLEDRAISLELTEPARQLILASGSDVAYGARPLKRALQRMVQDPLAIKILDGEVLHGSHVRIDVDRKTNQALRAIRARLKFAQSRSRKRDLGHLANFNPCKV